MSEAGFTTVSLRIDADREFELAEILGRHETLGSVIGENSGGAVEATVYLESGWRRSMEPLLRELEKIAVSVVSVGSEEERDWLENYRELVRPFPIGRTWWIDPHPAAPTLPPPGRRRLTVEPRMAFGTGSHESTRLVLLEFEDRPPADLSVLDVGCGSGILSLAAESLGAARATGLDIDLQAVLVARQIVADQDFPCSPLYLAGPLAAVGEASFDLVVCNMIVEHFRPLLDDIRRVVAASGQAVFSGILQTQEDEVRRDLEERGLVVDRVRRLDDWIALRVNRG